MPVPPVIAALNAGMRAYLRAECGGDWSRVTIDSRGDFVVHNTPQANGLGAAPAEPAAAHTLRPVKRPPPVTPPKAKAPARKAPAVKAPPRDPEPEPRPAVKKAAKKAARKAAKRPVTKPPAKVAAPDPNTPDPKSRAAGAVRVHEFAKKHGVGTGWVMARLEELGEAATPLAMVTTASQEVLLGAIDTTPPPKAEPVKGPVKKAEPPKKTAPAKRKAPEPVKRASAAPARAEQAPRVYALARELGMATGVLLDVLRQDDPYVTAVEAIPYERAEELRAQFRPVEEPPAPAAPPGGPRLRVYQLAHELGVTSKAVLRALARLDVDARTASTFVSSEHAVQVRAQLRPEATPEPEPVPEPVAEPVAEEPAESAEESAEEAPSFGADLEERLERTRAAKRAARTTASRSEAGRRAAKAAERTPGGVKLYVLAREMGVPTGALMDTVTNLGLIRPTPVSQIKPDLEARLRKIASAAGLLSEPAKSEQPAATKAVPKPTPKPVPKPTPKPLVAEPKPEPKPAVVSAVVTDLPAGDAKPVRPQPVDWLSQFSDGPEPEPEPEIEKEPEPKLLKSGGLDPSELADLDMASVADQLRDAGLKVRSTDDPAERTKLGKRRAPWDRRHMPRIETHRPPPAGQTAPDPDGFDPKDPRTFRRTELPPAAPNARRNGYDGVSPDGRVLRRRTSPPATTRTAPETKSAAPAARQPSGGTRGQLLIGGGDGALKSIDEQRAVAVPVEWEGSEEGLSIWALYVRAKDGLPEEVPLIISDDVAALGGVDLDMLESVVRSPERCEIDGSSKTKGWAVLKYWRGDVLVVVGFRDPLLPLVIAAYVHGLALADFHRRNVTGGGGGARKATGLPTRPEPLVRRLRDLGADIDWTAHDNVDTVEVFFGQGTERISLGKINVAPGTQRSVIETDYQRIQRKIAAINRRQETAAR